MQIVIEYVLLENFIIDFFIIKHTGYFLKEKVKLVWLSSLIGAILALISPILYLNKYIELCFKISTAVLILCISFNFKTIKKFCLNLSTFVMITFIYGGGCYAIQCIINEFTKVTILIATFVIYLCLSYVFKYYRKRDNITKFNFDVVLFNGEKVIKEKGFLDSGNLLYDPITSKPIILISLSVFEKLFQNIELNELLSHKIDCKRINKAHYIKFDTVGKSGKMLIFDIDKLQVKNDELNKITENVSVGLSLSGFEKSFGGNVLLHSGVL